MCRVSDCGPSLSLATVPDVTGDDEARSGAGDPLEAGVGL